MKTAAKNKTYKLGELFKITSGGTPNRANDSFYNGDVPWIKTGDLKVKHLSQANEYITKDGLENSSAKIFPINTVLVALYGATIGACSILKIEAATNQACAAFLPTKEVNPEFLYYYIKSIKPKLIEQGVGGGQPNISGQILKQTEITLPEFKEQNEIVNILEQGDTARQKRKQANQLTEQFLQSAFFEMFGDSGENKKKYDIFELDKICTKITDGEHNIPPRVETGVPLVMARNVRNGFLDFRDLSFVSKEDHEKAKKRCNPEQGDLLLVCVGATIGRLSIVPKTNPFSIVRSVALIKPDKAKVNSEYLLKALQSEFAQAYISSRKSTSAQAGLYINQIKKIPIPIPPIPLQQKFASLVERVEKLREKQRESEKELENLFQSLMQKYFEN